MTVFFLLFAAFSYPVKLIISYVKKKVGGDHTDVKYINEQRHPFNKYTGIEGQYLHNNTAKITEYYKTEKC